MDEFDWETIEGDYSEALQQSRKLWINAEYDVKFNEKFFNDYVCPKWEKFKKDLLESCGDS